MTDQEYVVQGHPAETHCRCNVIDVTMSSDRTRRYRRHPTPDCPLHSDGYPPGTRVHHGGAIHSVGQEPEHPDGGLRGGWGVVVRAIKQHDHTFEYEVAVDRDISGGLRRNETTSWWASYHINRVRLAED